MHVGHAVGDVARAEVGQAGDVVGLPAGGVDDGTDLEDDFLGGVVEIDDVGAGQGLPGLP